jgi:hypothetical protein
MQYGMSGCLQSLKCVFYYSYLKWYVVGGCIYSQLYLELYCRALPTGIGPTGNTIPDTVDCMYSHQLHNILINCKQLDISYEVLMLLVH